MRLCIEIYKELKVGVVMWQQTKCPRVELSANFITLSNALQLKRLIATFVQLELPVTLYTLLITVTVLYSL